MRYLRTGSSRIFHFLESRFRVAPSARVLNFPGNCERLKAEAAGLGKG
jgi:hypothetical protein